MERTKHEQLIFLYPASIAGMDESLEPGTYTVETVEELLWHTGASARPLSCRHASMAVLADN